MFSSKGLHIAADHFEENFYEFQRLKEIIKRVERDGNQLYAAGAIARVNNNRDKLSMRSQQYLKSLNFNNPDYNPFHNVLYQNSWIDSLYRKLCENALNCMLIRQCYHERI